MSDDQKTEESADLSAASAWDAPVAKPKAEPEPAAPEPPSEPVPAAPVGLHDGAWVAASSAWLNDHVRNSPIAQSAEAWNHLGVILPQLKAYIDRELAKLSS